MTPPSYQISPQLARATDQILQQAAEALEAAGADIDGQAQASQHTLIMPAMHLLAVLNAMEHWTMVSCAQGACESWTAPQARAAQGAYQTVEGIFEQGAAYRSVNKEAGFPMLVSGESLTALQDIRQEWAAACKPTRRPVPR